MVFLFFLLAIEMDHGCDSEVFFTDRYNTLINPQFLVRLSSAYIDDHIFGSLALLICVNAEFLIAVHQ